MDNKYVYLTKLPPHIKEIVLPCADGYTIYLDDRLTREQLSAAYQHALKHIAEDDFAPGDVQQIEAKAHGKG